MVRTPTLLLRRGLLRLLPSMLAAMLAAPAMAADDNSPLNAELRKVLEGWTRERAETADPGASSAGARRLEVELGQLDPRLRLAPCARIEPYLPGRQPALGSHAGRPALRRRPDTLERLPAGARCACWRRPRCCANRCPPAPSSHPNTWARPRSTGPTAAPAAPARPGAVDRPQADPRPGRRRPAARHRSAAPGVVRRRRHRQGTWPSAPGFEVSTQGQALGRGLDGQSVRVRTDGRPRRHRHGSGRTPGGVAVVNRTTARPDPPQSGVRYHFLAVATKVRNLDGR